MHDNEKVLKASDQRDEGGKEIWWVLGGKPCWNWTCSLLKMGFLRECTWLTGALDWHTPSTNLQEKADPIVIGDSTGLRILAIRMGLCWLRSEWSRTCFSHTQLWVLVWVYGGALGLIWCVRVLSFFFAVHHCLSCPAHPPLMCFLGSSGCYCI